MRTRVQPPRVEKKAAKQKIAKYLQPNKKGKLSNVKHSSVSVQTTTIIDLVAEQQLVVDMFLARRSINKALENLNDITGIVNIVKGKLKKKSRYYTAADNVLDNVNKTNN